MREHKPRPAEKIIEGLTEALAIAKGDAEPYRVTTFDVAPWLADRGVCPSCDRRRATGAAEARRQREKRARQKEKETTE